MCRRDIPFSAVGITAPAQEAFTLPAGVILAEYRDHFEAYEPLERRFLLYKGEGISPNQLSAAAHPKRTRDGAFPTHAQLFRRRSSRGSGLRRTARRCPRPTLHVAVPLAVLCLSVTLFEGERLFGLWDILIRLTAVFRRVLGCCRAITGEQLQCCFRLHRDCKGPAGNHHHRRNIVQNCGELLYPCLCLGGLGRVIAAGTDCGPGCSVDGRVQSSWPAYGELRERHQDLVELLDEADLQLCR